MAPYTDISIDDSAPVTPNTPARAVGKRPRARSTLSTPPPASPPPAPPSRRRRSPGGKSRQQTPAVEFVSEEPSRKRQRKGATRPPRSPSVVSSPGSVAGPSAPPAPRGGPSAPSAPRGGPSAGAGSGSAAGVAALAAAGSPAARRLPQTLRDIGAAFNSLQLLFVRCADDVDDILRQLRGN